MEKLDYLYTYFSKGSKERFPTSKRRDALVEATSYI